MTISATKIVAAMFCLAVILPSCDNKEHDLVRENPENTDSPSDNEPHGDKPSLPDGDYVLDASAVSFADGVVFMSREILSNTEILSKEEKYVITEDGYYIESNNVAIKMPYLEIKVSQDYGFRKGGMCVFDSIAEIPTGGVFTIKDKQMPAGDDGYVLLTLEPSSDPFKAYKKFDMGSTLYDADGNPVDGAGFNVDLSKYLSGVTDSNGDPVEFSQDENGEIVFSEDAVRSIATKAGTHFNNNISTPTLSLNFSKGATECSFGAKMGIDMTAAVRIDEGELTYLHFSFSPTINLSAKFSIKGELSIEEDVHLITLYFTPGIPVAPGVVLTPEVSISASVGLGGDIVFTTSIEKKIDLGRFGFAYMPAQGFFFRHQEAEPEPEEKIQPELGVSMEGSIYATAGLTVSPSITLYGLFTAGLDVGFSLKFGINRDWNNGRKLFLAPELQFTPVTASLGGRFSKKWNELIPKLEYEPLWERYLDPEDLVKQGESGIFQTPTLCGELHIPRTYKVSKDYVMQPNSAIPYLFSGNAICTNLDGFYTDLTIDKPLLDDWELMVARSACTKHWVPGSEDEWRQGMLLYTIGAGTGISSENVNTGNWMPSVGALESYDGVYVPLDTLSLGIFLSGKSEKQSIQGKTTASFSEGNLFSHRIIWKNLRTNNVVESVLNIYMKDVPYAYYWPEGPGGKPYYTQGFWEDNDAPDLGANYKEESQIYYPYL